MRIAQVAPLHESVPPKLYGDTERVVSYLTEALVARGHEVTLFASGDSETDARLISPCPTALRLQADLQDPLVYHLLLLEEVYRRAAEFDVIHFHVDYLHFARTRAAGLPHITTLHGRLDLPDLPALYREFSNMPLVSISQAQRAPLPQLAWAATVYHGLPTDFLPFQPKGGDYLLFLGRISPENRPDRAIAIAARAGVPLKIAATVDRNDAAYFQDVIGPLLRRHKNVEFLGEVNEAEKRELLGGALGLVFPIDWPEPFGLVMIEAMSCGTPVLAFPCGGVPEIIEDGVNGIVCSDVDTAVARVPELAKLSRHEVRQVFERRFSSARMAREYETIYEIQRTAHRQANSELAILDRRAPISYLPGHERGSALRRRASNLVPL